MPPTQPARLFLFATTGLLLLASFAAAAEPPRNPPAATRPGYLFLRWQENWSSLPAVPDYGQDPFDRAKYVPLADDHTRWASFGGDLRLRAEDWRGFNFGAPRGASHDDTFLLTRVRAHADVQFAPTVRVFGEVKGAYASDRDLPGGVRVVDQDKAELQQLFVDLKFDLGGKDSLVLRPGRFGLSFGAQRLVSALPWANSLRTWDGLQVLVTTRGWNLTFFEAAFVPVTARGIGETDTDELIGGVYARRLFAGPGDGLELYALHNDWDAPRTFNGTRGSDERITLGGRRWATFASRFDYEVEVSLQLGRTGGGDVAAQSFAGQIGYQVADDKSLRLWAGLDWASGDRTPGGDVQTFNQLYPLGHAYFGAIDMIGRQNIIDWSIGATWKPWPKLTLNLGAHAFRAESTRDAIYNAGGGIVRAGGTFNSDEIGQEFDLVATWAASRHLVLEAGYGHFFSGTAIRQSGPARDTDFVYLSTTFTF